MPHPLQRAISHGPDLVTSLRQLRDCPYYWGPLDKEEASAKLQNQPVGSFLLRDSSDDKHFFALSFRMSDGTHHVRISYTGGSFCFDHVYNNMRYSTITELIHNTITRSRNREIQFFIRPRDPHEAPVPISILYPLSRDYLVHSLLHIVRSNIRKYVRFDHIDLLNLPNSLKEYLRSSQYLYEESSTPPCTDSEERTEMNPANYIGLRIDNAISH